MRYTKHTLTVLVIAMTASVVFVGTAAADAPDCSTVSYNTDTDGALLVEDVDQLQCMSEDLSADYRLANDIDATETDSWNGGQGFDPVGNSGTPFTGTLDGDGYTASDLYIDRGSEDYVGLFGFVEDGKISDFSLDAVDVEGKDYVGGVVGEMDRTKLFDVTVTGDVIGDTSLGWATGGVVGGNYENSTVVDVESHARVTGYDGVGGVAGENWESDVKNAQATGNVDGGSYGVGGLIGASYGDSSNGLLNTVSDSSATGDVTGEEWVGGLVGESWMTKISNSEASGDVTAPLDSTEWSIGGLAGANYGGIYDSSAEGDVAGGYQVGGLVGENEDTSGDVLNATVHDSYATGDVEGVNSVGGLIGASYEFDSNNDFRPDVRRSFAIGEVTGQDGVGGLVGVQTEGNTVNTHAWGNVEGNDSVGGLVGVLGAESPSDRPREVRTSYSTGIVTGNTSSTTGGLIGKNVVGSTTTSSTSVAAENGLDEGEIRGPTGVPSAPNRRVTETEDTTGTIQTTDTDTTIQANSGVTDSYWDEEASGLSTSDGGTPLTTDKMTGGDAPTNMGGFDFTNTWITVTDDYPILANAPDFLSEEDTEECMTRRSVSRGNEGEECPHENGISRGESHEGFDRGYDRGTPRSDRGRGDDRSRRGGGR